MSVVPTWQGATSGVAGAAAQVNQFLASHTSQYLYAGSQTTSVVTSGAAATSTNGLWIAQSFTTAVGQTAIGYIQGPISTTTTSGASLAPTTLSLYASSGVAPTGSPLVSTTLTAEYAYLSTANGNTNTFTIYPLPITGLTQSTTYWLVLQSTASVGAFTWFRSAATSGASTSTNGTTWTAQTYGLRYSTFDQTASGNMTCTWEDAGSRWTASTYNSTTGALATYAEYTVSQGSAQYVQGYRTLSYSSGLLTKVA